MERYVCIHGHFYQPPRENPWLEAIEVQDSAYPYHDWNERITAECYATNASSRILDHEGWITAIVNNYSRISFNFGPTLLSWMETNARDTYEAILEADRKSRERFSGHGSAFAQAYNHIIMPLANRRDKSTQILWGIRDFQRRFGRDPEGMWLPETAVDLESLELMAELGIRFTLLSPYQANHARKLHTRNWRDVHGGQVDPSRPYRVNLPSGRSIDVFFYDGPISRAVAFERLLENGEHFAKRLASAFSEDRKGPQLAHIATDGESYGHHHRHGEMALSYALKYIEENQLARLTNYGEYLEKFPPKHEAEIFEATAWSCIHGVGRWAEDCGCNSGGHPDWNQAWRAPLREALDWLRDEIAPLYERKAANFLQDPWAARDDYVEVILDRSPETQEKFFEKHALRPLEEGEKVSVLKLLDLQRHALLMYTSCGWFFDELSGIETVQVMQYAGRVVQLAEEMFGNSFEPHFLERLERATSNLPEQGDGRLIYEAYVKPAMVDLEKVGAHYAVSSLFEDNEGTTQTYCYSVEREDYKLLSQGKTRLAVGRARITSRITRESKVVSFGVLHLGDHNLSGGIRTARGQEAYDAVMKEISETFQRGDFPELIRHLDDNFDSGAYTLKLLFREEQRKILRLILQSTLEEVEAAYRKVYEDHAPLMRFMTGMGVPLPKLFEVAAEFTLNTELRRAFQAGELDSGRVRAVLEEAKTAGIPLDHVSLEFALRRTLERMAEEFRDNPEGLALLKELDSAAILAESLPFEVTVWKPQNVYFQLRDSVYPARKEKAEQGDEDAQEWVRVFDSLGAKLKVRPG